MSEDDKVVGISLWAELSGLAEAIAGTQMLLEAGGGEISRVDALKAGPAILALVCARLGLVEKVIRKDLEPRHLLTSENCVRDGDGPTADDIIIGFKEDSGEAAS